MRNIKLILAALLAFSPFIANADPIGFSVTIGGNTLQTIDFATGTVTDVGATGVQSMRGLTFIGDTLYGVSQVTDSLYTLNTATGLATLVGALGVDGIGGLAADSAGNLFFAREFGGEDLFSVNPATGATTLIGSTGVSITGLSFDASNVLYGLADLPDDALYTINTGDGSATEVGASGMTVSDLGMSFADSGTLYYVASTGSIGTVNTGTGAMTELFDLTGSYSSLAFRKSPVGVPEPGTLMLLSIGLIGAGVARRRRKT